jgi:peptide/nickel transport system ATP-binding protein
MSRVLELQELDIAFGSERVVCGLDLHLDTGETLALVGESGCGKSTTALAIMGLLPASAAVQGKILLDGEDLLSLGASRLRTLRGSGVSMIFQEPMTSLNPVMTIGRQITEVLHRHRRLSRREADERAVELLDLVRIPKARARFDDFPHRLSGGQRQRVMIAMAVACEPRLLIADEPTTALDVTIQAEILSLLDELRSRIKMSLLLITHDLGVVGRYADRVAVMFAGEKVEEGEVADIFRAPAHTYTQGLLGASLTLEQDLHYRDGRLAEVRPIRDAHTGEIGFTLSRERAQHTINGKQFGDHASDALDVLDALDVSNGSGVSDASGLERSWAAAPERLGAAPPERLGANPSRPLLRVSDVHTHYTRDGHRVNAVDGVTFEIARGETLGLVGESGCGKSSLSRTLLRLVPSAAGKIELDGEDITHLKGEALRVVRRKAQMIFQDPFASLNPRHTVRTMLDAALRVHGIADPEERYARILEVLRRVDLPIDALRRYAHEFSGGQRQRIGIARALVLRPALVICDEPVSALDVSVRAQVLNLLVELKRDLGLSYLFISHDLAVVRYIADRVLIMHAGRIVEQGDHHGIWKHPTHEYTRTLIHAVPRRPVGAPSLPDFGTAPRLEHSLA